MAKDNIPTNAGNGARRKQVSKDLNLLEKSIEAVAKRYPKKKVAATLQSEVQKIALMRNQLKNLKKSDSPTMKDIEKDLYSLAFRMRAIFPKPDLGGSSTLKPKNGAKELSRKDLKLESQAHHNLAKIVQRYEPVGRSVRAGQPLPRTR